MFDLLVYFISNSLVKLLMKFKVNFHHTLLLDPDKDFLEDLETKIVCMK